jgi:hypothetical protein
MALTNLTTSLGSFNPVFNPLVYGFDSSNKNEPGFRYVVEVYPAGASAAQISNRIFEARVAPRPNDGYGYIDLSKIIANRMTSDLQLASTTSYAALNSFYAYDVYIGEEYVTNWPYQASLPLPNNRTMLGPTGGTGASGTQPAHNYVVNDQILIKQTAAPSSPDYRALIEGLHTVFDVPDTFNIVIDVPLAGGTSTGGLTTYADNRTTIFRGWNSAGMLTYSDQVAWNGALQWSDWPTYNEINYRVNGATASSNKVLLTNLPENFWVTEKQDLHILFAVGTTGATTTRAYFQNDTGDLFYKSISDPGYCRIFTAGPSSSGSLVGVTGSAPLVKPTTAYYDFWMADSTGATVSQSYTVNIDRRCEIDDVEILFLDRLGSYLSYSFNLRKIHRGTVKRETFNRQVGNITGNKWSYNIAEGGVLNSDISADEEFEIRTNWMTYEMNVYFEELVTSAVTYIRLNGTYYSCIILDNTFEIQSASNKKPIRRTLRVQLSSSSIVNI